MRWCFRERGRYRSASWWTFTPRVSGQLVGVRVRARDGRALRELTCDGRLLYSAQQPLVSAVTCSHPTRQGEQLAVLVAGGALEEMVEVFWLFESERTPHRLAQPA